MDYRVKIAELRRLAGKLSQKSLAAKLGLKRGAVAQWEGGVREPRERNCLALAKLAAEAGQPEIEKFFLSMVSQRKAGIDATRKAEFVKRYYRSIAALRKASGQGFLGRIAELSKMEGDDLAAYQAGRIIRGKRSLDRHAFAEEFYRVTFETEAAKLARLAARAKGTKRTE